MYDGLVKMLRVCGDSNNSCENCPARENDGSCPHGEWEFAAEKYMLQAADAIEERERLIDAQLAIIKQYQEYLSKRRWIPVTERLPEDDGEYLVWFYDAKCWKVAEFNKHTAKEPHIWWFAGIDRTKFVTLWMPLPEPPKEET